MRGNWMTLVLLAGFACAADANRLDLHLTNGLVLKNCQVENQGWGTFWIKHAKCACFAPPPSAAPTSAVTKAVMRHEYDAHGAIVASFYQASFTGAELVTTRGDVYHNPKEILRDADGVIFRHDGGIVKLEYAVLPAPFDKPNDAVKAQEALASAPMAEPTTDAKAKEDDRMWDPSTWKDKNDAAPQPVAARQTFPSEESSFASAGAGQPPVDYWYAPDSQIPFPAWGMEYYYRNRTGTSHGRDGRHDGQLSGPPSGPASNRNFSFGGVRGWLWDSSNPPQK